MDKGLREWVLTTFEPWEALTIMVASFFIGYLISTIRRQRKQIEQLQNRELQTDQKIQRTVSLVQTLTEVNGLVNSIDSSVRGIDGKVDQVNNNLQLILRDKS